MANVAGKQSQQIIGDINITPLTDIFLVMLIIMMVVATSPDTLEAIPAPATPSSGAPKWPKIKM